MNNYQGGYIQAFPLQEAARLVLGSQSPPLGMVPICFIDTNYSNPGMDLVPTQSYDPDPAFKWFYCHAQYANASGFYQDELLVKSKSIMLVGPM